MGFPSLDAIRSTYDALNQARQEATRVKRWWASTRPAYTSVNQSANSIIALVSDLKSAIEIWQACATVPGIADYARAQFGDAGRDVVAEFSAMVNAAIAARDWIVANFPKSGGFILKDQLAADGSISVRAFTPAQLVGLIAAMDTLAGTID